MNERPLVFDPAIRAAPGELLDIIARSYAVLVTREPAIWGGERRNWEDFDRGVFDHPETLGRCAFVSRLGCEAVGLASYDPRLWPAYGVVGQNCVLPEYRSRGIGRRQILEILRRFREAGFEAARVTTSEHPFFQPALRLYKALGFRETGRPAGGPDARFRLIELEKPSLLEPPLL
jgi:ribosomal protein S18 acetylase RimI-like enzyme